ncbi:hypothetical protein PHYPSEUDO_008266 [Phytophthora pseudosyringae]|uniref:Uncharacterized protein n=1 Tax=Phytophthora pseudosyringae TaxID=221518 RepID=A0A8T1VHI5_9STRA|nr:hypothetical protein PHYPSEUDO_008266 [Phytophthora pseudosyringae]
MDEGAGTPVTALVVSACSALEECLEGRCTDASSVRTPSVVQPALYGGTTTGRAGRRATRAAARRPVCAKPPCAPCTVPALDGIASCDLVNCVVGNWDATRSPCDATSCLRELTRPILQTALYGETACPMTVKNKSCDPVNGTVNESVQWGACAASSGKKAGSRTVKQLDLYGGCKFPGLTQEKLRWLEHLRIVRYEHRTLKTRRRGILQKDKYGGFYSPETTNTEPCETADCVMNDFVPWSASDAITDSNTRSRTVRVFIVYGGCTCLDSSGVATGGTIVN